MRKRQLITSISRAVIALMVALCLLLTACGEKQTYYIMDLETNEIIAIVQGTAKSTENGVNVGGIEFPNCIAILAEKEAEQWNNNEISI